MPKKKLTEPHTKLIRLSTGKTAIIIENKDLSHVIDGMASADTWEGLEHYSQIITNANIIKN